MISIKKDTAPEVDHGSPENGGTFSKEIPWFYVKLWGWYLPWVFCLRPEQISKNNGRLGVKRRKVGSKNGPPPRRSLDWGG